MLGDVENTIPWGTFLAQMLAGFDFGVGLRSSIILSLSTEWKAQEQGEAGTGVIR